MRMSLTPRRSRAFPSFEGRAFGHGCFLRTILTERRRAKNISLVIPFQHCAVVSGKPLAAAGSVGLDQRVANLARGGLFWTKIRRV